jgi:hypothetical protein
MTSACCRNPALTGLTQVYGGYTCLSHWTLRLVLWRSGAMPRRYIRFLDECAKRSLLRRVGGGYSFPPPPAAGLVCSVVHTGPEPQHSPGHGHRTAVPNWSTLDHSDASTSRRD